MASVHTVQAGDCLLSICHQYGFNDWKVLYDHPANAQLRKMRPDPHMLVPGDRVVIPERKAKVLEVASGKTHVFKVKTMKTRLRLRVHEHVEGMPSSGTYQLDVEGMRRRHEGVIGDDGLLDVEIPAAAQHGTLTVLQDGKVINVFHLELGGMAPPDTVAGVQARLKHLGLDCGPSDGILGPRTRQALQVFRTRYDLSTPEDAETTHVDAATCDKLSELCGT